MKRNLLYQLLSRPCTLITPEHVIAQIYASSGVISHASTFLACKTSSCVGKSIFSEKLLCGVYSTQLFWTFCFSCFQSAATGSVDGSDDSVVITCIFYCCYFGFGCGSFTYTVAAYSCMSVHVCCHYCSKSLMLGCMQTAICTGDNWNSWSAIYRDTES